MNPPVVSIDPSSARDLDDAISVTRMIDGGWHVDACIPDVPSLVAKGDAADRMAWERVVTRYYGDAIRQPMLPPAIAEALSLSPDEDRPMTWFSIDLDATLQVTDVRIQRMKGRTLAALSYRDADRILDDERHLLHAPLNAAWRLACLLHDDRRHRTGAVFDMRRGLFTTEEGAVARLTARTSHRSHMLVMEIMILVNGALARHAERNGIPIIYRNHRPQETSSGFRADVLREMSEIEGLDPAAASDRLRILASRIGPAGFGTTNQGHWGLDMPQYAMFTSPLRRYCDLVNARAMVHGIADDDAVGTAAHIEREMRLERERSADHHGAKARSVVAQHARAGRMNHLTDFDLHTILRACSENSVVSPHVEDELRRRFDAGTVSGKDVESVFIYGRDVLPDDAVRHVVQWLRDDADHRCVFRAHLEATGRSAERMSDIVGERLPEDEAEVPRAEMPDNPKGMLLELAQARRAEVSFSEPRRVGPPHLPRFTITSTWTDADGIETASASAGTVRAAAHASAWALHGKVADRTTDPRTVAARPTTPVESGKHPKTELLEIATARRARVTFATPTRQGPPHAPMFHASVRWTDGTNDMDERGEGPSIKAAERIAAERMMARLSQERRAA